MDETGWETENIAVENAAVIWDDEHGFVLTMFYRTHTYQKEPHRKTYVVVNIQSLIRLIGPLVIAEPIALQIGKDRESNNLGKILYDFLESPVEVSIYEPNFHADTDEG